MHYSINRWFANRFRGSPWCCRWSGTRTPQPQPLVPLSARPPWRQTPDPSLAAKSRQRPFSACVQAPPPRPIAAKTRLRASNSNPGVDNSNPGVGHSNPGIGGASLGVGEASPGFSDSNPGIAASSPQKGRFSPQNPLFRPKLAKFDQPTRHTPPQTLTSPPPLRQKRRRDHNFAFIVKAAPLLSRQSASRDWITLPGGVTFRYPTILAPCKNRTAGW